MPLKFKRPERFDQLLWPTSGEGLLALLQKRSVIHGMVTNIELLNASLRDSSSCGQGISSDKRLFASVRLRLILCEM
jgi:hypothetical protein